MSNFKSLISNPYPITSSSNLWIESLPSICSFRELIFNEISYKNTWSVRCIRTIQKNNNLLFSILSCFTNSYLFNQLKMPQRNQVRLVIDRKHCFLGCYWLFSPKGLSQARSRCWDSANGLENHRTKLGNGYFTLPICYESTLIKRKSVKFYKNVYFFCKSVGESVLMCSLSDQKLS